MDGASNEGGYSKRGLQFTTSKLLLDGGTNRNSDLCMANRNDPYASLQYRLLRARLHNGLTHDAVALACKITRPSVSMWERGQSRPSEKNAKVIARLYGVSELWLMSREGRDPVLNPLPANILRHGMARHRQARQ